MSEWAKELLADVAREINPDYVEVQDIKGILYRRLLALLEAGQEMRDKYAIRTAMAIQWDAAKAKASRP